MELMMKKAITYLLVILIFTNLYSLELQKIDEFYFNREGLPLLVSGTNNGFYISMGHSLYFYDENGERNNISSLIPDELSIFSMSFMDNSLLFISGHSGWFSGITLVEENRLDSNLDALITSKDELLIIRNIFWDTDTSFFIERYFPGEKKVKIQKYSLISGFCETVITENELMVFDHKLNSKDFIYGINIPYKGYEYYITNNEDKYKIDEKELITSAVYIGNNRFLTSCINNFKLYNIDEGITKMENINSEETRIYSIDYDFERNILFVIGKKNDQLCLTEYLVINN